MLSSTLITVADVIVSNISLFARQHDAEKKLNATHWSPVEQVQKRCPDVFRIPPLDVAPRRLRGLMSLLRVVVTYAASKPCDVTPCESLATFSTLYGTDDVSECVCASKEEARRFEMTPSLIF